MRKKLIITNSIIVFVSLVILLIVSGIIISKVNDNNTKEEIKSYLNIAEGVFTGSNYTETVEIINNAKPTLRITFISLDGEVLYDTLAEGELDSHSNRPEIINLGTVVTRYSDTLSLRMMYVASVDSGVYLRVAIPISSVNNIIFNFMLVSIITLIIITILSILIMMPINKETLKPLKKVVDKMEKIVEFSGDYYYDNIETLSHHIDKVSNLLNERIKDVEEEKQKVDFILNNMNQGLIVISSDKKVVLVNDYICNIFNLKKENIINKDYLYVIRDVELQKQISKAIEDSLISSLEIKVSDQVYLVYFNTIKNSWLTHSNSKSGVALLFTNITKTKKIEIIKKEFFANASHELKSPLTTIIGYQQMIQEGIIKDKKEIELATANTIKEANRMNAILSEMLELSKLENIKKPKIDDVDISLIIKDIINSCSNNIKNKNLSINLDLKDVIIKMNTDHAIHLVRNLIDNAIKYNIDQGFINIKLDKNLLTIADSGIGIDEEHQTRIFERFYRVDKGKSKELGGTGLGLAIVKHICSLYNFNISLKSKKNQGTEFTIDFKS
ncbi:MAG: ATP-binding protein [Bacilli bacterium]|nr:ATP-binding protein [Bacilli bacterium]